MENVFVIVSLVSSLSVILSVALQDGADQSMSAVTGSAPLWGQSRGQSKQDVLKRITVLSAIVFIISHLVLAAI